MRNWERAQRSRDTRTTAEMNQTSTTHRPPRATNCTPHGAPHTARGLPEPQRDHQTLPNNVARNSPRSLFDYVSKRCNSNAANSTFEIVARELRAKLIEQARRHPTAPGAKQALRHQDRVTRVRRHRKPRRLVTTGNAATASSIEEPGPAPTRGTGPECIHGLSRATQASRRRAPGLPLPHRARSARSRHPP